MEENATRYFQIFQKHPKSDHLDWRFIRDHLNQIDKYHQKSNPQMSLEIVISAFLRPVNEGINKALPVYI